MKQCTYCGKEFPDEASACSVDGQPLRDVIPPPPEPPPLATSKMQKEVADQIAPSSGPLDKLASRPAMPLIPPSEIKGSGVAVVLQLIAGVEILASIAAGCSEGVIGGSGDAQRGWLIFAAGTTGGLVLAGFGCIIDYSYECAQRLRRIEDILRKANADEKDK